MKISELPGDEDSGLTCRTYVFQNESHTLGNALKCIINRYPEFQTQFEFCMKNFGMCVTSHKTSMDLLHWEVPIRKTYSEIVSGNRVDDVQFCGYTVPHPAEPKMHFRIQSHETPALEVLKRGLKDLEKVCDHTIDTFEKEVKEFSKT